MTDQDDRQEDQDNQELIDKDESGKTPQKTPQDYIIERKEKRIKELQEKQRELEEEMNMYKPKADPQNVDLWKVAEDIETLNSRIQEEPFLAEKKAELKKLMRDNPTKDIDELIIKSFGSLAEYRKKAIEYTSEATQDINRTRMAQGTTPQKPVNAEYRAGMSVEEHRAFKKKMGL